MNTEKLIDKIKTRLDENTADAEIFNEVLMTLEKYRAGFSQALAVKTMWERRAEALFLQNKKLKREKTQIKLQ